MCKLYKYVIIKDGVLCVLETDRIVKPQTLPIIKTHKTAN